MIGKSFQITEYVRTTVVLAVGTPLVVIAALPPTANICILFAYHLDIPFDEA
jgi:hypothetical protein